MDTRRSEQLEQHVLAAVRRILASYEQGVAPFDPAPRDTSDALARELDAVIGTLPQPRVRERLLAEVARLLRAVGPIS